MTGETGSRIDFAVDLMLAQIVATMRKGPFRGIEKLAARLDLFLVGMAVGTEGLLMAGGAGKFRAGINFVLGHEIRGFVVERAP